MLPNRGERKINSSAENRVVSTKVLAARKGSGWKINPQGKKLTLSWSNFNPTSGDPGQEFTFPP